MMIPIAAGGPDIASVFLELGAMIVGMALLARLAARIGFSPIPLYLLGGLAFGTGGILPIIFSEEFIEIGAEIGVILLLFMLGLEYTDEELKTNLRAGFPAGLLDLGLNFTPGLVAGLLLGWSWLAALLLGGVTYISSSGVIAKLLSDLNRLGNRETPVVLAIWWAARRAGVATRGRFRAGFTLVARGEFSIVIAGLGVSANPEPQLGPLAAAYVLFLAILGPILARIGDPVVAMVQHRWAVLMADSSQ